ncbi:hypothetical protein D0V11_25350 [Salmonella enterica]|nr:hypothetical protein [Salmonella enterica]
MFCIRIRAPHIKTGNSQPFRVQCQIKSRPIQVKSVNTLRFCRTLTTTRFCRSRELPREIDG